ncbi:unnamed protein product [Pedinophyceae sp. YPF-701]|nr:unnamed protein product [Pedinophyceae sp. YPF-701]
MAPLPEIPEDGAGPQVAGEEARCNDAGWPVAAVLCGRDVKHTDRRALVVVADAARDAALVLRAHDEETSCGCDAHTVTLPVRDMMYAALLDGVHGSAILVVASASGARAMRIPQPWTETTVPNPFDPSRALTGPRVWVVLRTLGAAAPRGLLARPTRLGPGAAPLLRMLSLVGFVAPDAKPYQLEACLTELRNAYVQDEERLLAAIAAGDGAAAERLVLDRLASPDLRLLRAAGGAPVLARALDALRGASGKVRAAVLRDARCTLAGEAHPGDGHTLLAWACLHASPEGVAELLECRGVDPSAGALPALHVAAEHGRAAAVRVLAGHRRVDVDEGAASDDGLLQERCPGAVGGSGASGRAWFHTALHRAALVGAEDVVRALLGGGADVDGVDSAGRTAADVAEIARHAAIAQLLRAQPLDD